MYAKIILATPGRGLYAAHVRMQGVTVFEVVEGPPLRVGDIIVSGFDSTGRQKAEIPALRKEIVIDVIKMHISPIAARFCLDAPEECLREDREEQDETFDGGLAPIEEG